MFRRLEVSVTLFVCVTFALTSNAVPEEQRGFLSPIRSSFDARLVCRIGPHRTTVRQKYSISETLKLEYSFNLREVRSDVFRVAFFHRGLNRMVMTDSGDKMFAESRLGPNDFDPSPPKATGTAGEWRRTSEFVAGEPGMFTINVTWLLSRRKPDGTGWLESVESGPILLVVEPTDAWRKMSPPLENRANLADLFGVSSQQRSLESTYANGEHEP
jgi:hypothetical protein